VGEIDLNVVPLVESERARALVGAEAEQRLAGDDVAASGLAPDDSLELAQLFERIDANVGVGADAQCDSARAYALDRQEAVAEVRLRRRAGTDTRAGPGDEIELCTVCVRRVYDRGAFAEAAGSIQELDRPEPVFGETLLDLARLFVRVYVQGQPFRNGVAADLLEPVRWTGAHGVGGDSDADPAVAQIVDLLQILGDRRLTEARETSPSIRGEQDDYAELRLLRSSHCGQRFVEAEVVELADRGVARGPELPVDLHVLSADELGGLALGLGEHQLTPAPEVGASSSPAQRALEAVAVGVHEAVQAEGFGHGRILSTLMATRAVPATLQQLPNALTVARLALIPVFVALMLSADGGHSWPAGIVFGIAGVTDQIDGFLARRWQVESDFGRIFDPLADRLMIDAAVILLAVQDHMPWAGLVVILGRDLLLLAGYKTIAPEGYELNVNLLGKAATWLLYLGIGCLIVTHRSTEWPYWIFWTGLVLAVAAGVVYAVGAWRESRR
jgi:CDP-diacylglycerol---glycerol-3-phosphate 3-phosphatidyltransferase